MNPTLSQHKPFRIVLTCLLALIFFLSSCVKTTQPASSGAETGTPVGSETTNVPLPTETLTATPTLLSVNAAANSDFGLIVFSMGDGIYSHLFVYNPYSIPFTRLTAGNWDDEDPVISPDGKQIAFSSNRDGQWDIYILDLTLDKITRVTDTNEYDGHPSWSPDGMNLVYQTLNGKNLDLIIQTVSDQKTTPIQITEKEGDNFDAAWSPDGQTIAFVTNRNGRNEIWLFDLKTAENRFTILADSDQADYIDPSWSPDGTKLAWCKKDTEDHIEVVSLAETTSSPKTVGIGCLPVWSPDGNTIFGTFQQPNSQYLTAYKIDNNMLAFPMIQTESQVQAMDWRGQDVAKYLITYINLQSLPVPTALFTASITSDNSETGRNKVVELKNVNAPYDYLSDTTDEAFNALRSAIGKEVGWDFLANLDDAYLPITATTYPGVVQNWLYTGRAIAVSSGALSAGWMTVTREDYGGETYWRVWVKCLDQTGLCGKPITSHTWDFSARNSGDLQAYEDGGVLAAIPDGYWVDFTDYARRFGWERLPSQNNWRSYFQGALFNQFVFRQGLTWKQAMLQINSPDAVSLFESSDQ